MVVLPEVISASEISTGLLPTEPVACTELGAAAYHSNIDMRCLHFIHDDLCRASRQLHLDTDLHLLCVAAARVGSACAATGRCAWCSAADRSRATSGP